MSDRAVIKGHTIHRTIRLEASLDEVWAALTEGELLGRWFSDFATFDGVIAVGSQGVFAWEGHGEFAVVFEQLEPKSVVAWRWAGEPSLELKEDDSTTARFTLEADGDATVLTVVESGFEKIAGGTAHRRRRLEDNRSGWDIELDELADLLGA